VDRQTRGVDFLIRPWVPPVGGEGEVPLRAVARVVNGYVPGQGGIDGGGFTLVTETESYLYYQFESLKKGFIDDVEFAKSPSPSSGILVRSASRLGQTDFGVNAIRLNAIADVLRKEGWTIERITQKSHPDYWVTSDEAREATFDKDRRNLE